MRRKKGEEVMSEGERPYSVYYDRIWGENQELDQKSLVALYDIALRLLVREGLEGYRTAANSTMLNSLSASLNSRFPAQVEHSKKVFQDLTYKLLADRMDIDEEDLQIITLEEKRDVKKYLQDKGDYIGD